MRKHDYSEGIHGGLIKKAQHRWRCVPLNVLTQGSLHYRLATLGYQKRNPDGVPQFYKKTLRSLFHLKWLSKTEPLWGSSIFTTSFAPTLPFEMAIKSGRRWGRLLHKSCKKTLPALPSPWRGVGGEALMLRLYSKLGIFLWFSLLFRIFHQT